MALRPLFCLFLSGRLRQVSLFIVVILGHFALVQINKFVLAKNSNHLLVHLFKGVLV